VPSPLSANIGLFAGLSATGVSWAYRAACRHITRRGFPPGLRLRVGDVFVVRTNQAHDTKVPRGRLLLAMNPSLYSVLPAKLRAAPRDCSRHPHRSSANRAAVDASQTADANQAIQHPDMRSVSDGK